MIHSIKIQGYRGFEQFDVPDLGRINLLVGTNNSGKTSVLEAIYLLTSVGDPFSLWQLLWRRGERSAVVPNPERPQRQRQQMELDIAHLFTGHDIHPGSRISLIAKNQTPERSVSLTVSELSGKERSELFGPDDEGTLTSRLVLQIKGHPKPPAAVIPLSRAGGLVADTLDMPTRRLRQRTSEIFPAYFIATESVTSDELVAFWNKVALTPNETLVLNALKFLDPQIERIAAQVNLPGYYGAQSRGGFIVKREGIEQPIPIGSMGDGMWRMLAMAIALTQCKGGVLLVDEIDTGLHYTVMSQIWRLIFNAAKELDVQVFATTHSYDCVYSLAQICTEVDSVNKVTVQRIEAGKSKSVPYDQEEITVAAAREIEVR
jgi:hypothetical protein